MGIQRHHNYLLPKTAASRVDGTRHEGVSTVRRKASLPRNQLKTLANALSPKSVDPKADATRAARE